MAMKIHFGMEGLQIPQPVLTIGTFDGVHIGHQKIIDHLNKEAELIGGESVLLTFDPHPRMVLNPDSHGLKLLQTLNEKIGKLERMGLQNLIIYPFDFEFSRLSAIDFVKEILYAKLKVRKLVIGYDHQFGNKREGNIDFLKNVSKEFNFEVVEIPAWEIDEVNVSSTRVRTALLKGDILTASKFLGEPFSIQGVVTKGKQLGRTIGYPTANLSVTDPCKIIPAKGVYGVRCWLDKKEYRGMINIGSRPTVSDEQSTHLEVHLFDFNSDIYGATIVVEFIARIRDEQKFPSLDDLVKQLKSDEQNVRTFFDLPLV
jgi:riboflavin kinase/FMN adenylyltransferase